MTNKQAGKMTDNQTKEMANGPQTDRQTKSYTCIQAERKTEEPLMVELYM